MNNTLYAAIGETDTLSDSIAFNEVLIFYKDQYPDSLIKTESELVQDDFAEGLDIYGVSR